MPAIVTRRLLGAALLRCRRLINRATPVGARRRPPRGAWLRTRRVAMLTALLVLLLVLGTTGARANSTPGLVEQWYLHHHDALRARIASRSTAPARPVPVPPDLRRHPRRQPGPPVLHLLPRVGARARWAT
jgi:hypothetical protein